MGFLDGGVASTFASIFGGIYLDGSLFRKTTESDDGAGGGAATDDDGRFGTAEPVKFQPEATTQAMRDSPGYVDTDKRYLVLAHELEEPTTDDELEAEGQRWLIVNWGRDPCGAYYDCHCRHLREADVS